jgi:hypothetical protein
LTKVSQVSTVCKNTIAGLVSSIALRKNCLRGAGYREGEYLTSAGEAFERARSTLVLVLTNTEGGVDGADDESEDGAGTSEKRE